MGDVASDFPLFPLPLVALPSEQVPLHIFEERYKTMIGECLESSAEFGIVWLSDDELKGIGCAVQVDRVLERFDRAGEYVRRWVPELRDVDDADILDPPPPVRGATGYPEPIVDHHAERRVALQRYR